MILNLTEQPTLILIDIQKGMDEIDYWGGERSTPNAESNMTKILSFWRENKLPIYHVKHNSTNPQSPLRPGQEGNTFKQEAMPLEHEPIIEKTVNSAFIGTDLEDQLKEKGLNKLVIIGLTTEHCVSTTTRMAGNLGFEVYLIADATAAFNKVGPDGTLYAAKTIHDTALAQLHEEFATVINTEKLLNLLSNN